MKKLILSVVTLFACFTAELGSGTAHATFFWDVSAEAGSVSAPVALGEKINLNACGSRLVVANNTSFGTSLCNLSSQNVQHFSVNWFGINRTTNAFAWLTNNFSFGSTSNLVTSLSTGAGTFFNSVGTYAIGVYVSVRNDVTFSELISNGGNPFSFSANTSNDSTSSLNTAFQNNGSLNQGVDLTSNFSVTAANSPVVTPVPEPSAALLLIPAMLLVAQRQRRRRKQAL